MKVLTDEEIRGMEESELNSLKNDIKKAIGNPLNLAKKGKLEEYFKRVDSIEKEKQSKRLIERLNNSTKLIDDDTLTIEDHIKFLKDNSTGKKLPISAEYFGTRINRYRNDLNEGRKFREDNGLLENYEIKEKLALLEEKTNNFEKLINEAIEKEKHTKSDNETNKDNDDLTSSTEVDEKDLEGTKPKETQKPQESLEQSDMPDAEDRHDTKEKETPPKTSPEKKAETEDEEELQGENRVQESMYLEKKSFGELIKMSESDLEALYSAVKLEIKNASLFEIGKKKKLKEYKDTIERAIGHKKNIKTDLIKSLDETSNSLQLDNKQLEDFKNSLGDNNKKGVENEVEYLSGFYRSLQFAKNRISGYKNKASEYDLLNELVTLFDKAEEQYNKLEQAIKDTSSKIDQINASKSTNHIVNEGQDPDKQGDAVQEAQDEKKEGQNPTGKKDLEGEHVDPTKNDDSKKDLETTKQQPVTDSDVKQDEQPDSAVGDNGVSNTPPENDNTEKQEPQFKIELVPRTLSEEDKEEIRQSMKSVELLIREFDGRWISGLNDSAVQSNLNTAKQILSRKKDVSMDREEKRNIELEIARLENLSKSMKSKFFEEKRVPTENSEENSRNVEIENSQTSQQQNASNSQGIGIEIKSNEELAQMSIEELKNLIVLVGQEIKKADKSNVKTLKKYNEVIKKTVDAKIAKEQEEAKAKEKEEKSRQLEDKKKAEKEAKAKEKEEKKKQLEDKKKAEKEAKAKEKEEKKKQREDKKKEGKEAKAEKKEEKGEQREAEKESHEEKKSDSAQTADTKDTTKSATDKTTNKDNKASEEKPKSKSQRKAHKMAFLKRLLLALLHIPSTIKDKIKKKFIERQGKEAGYENVADAEKELNKEQKKENKESESEKDSENSDNSKEKKKQKRTNKLKFLKRILNGFVFVAKNIKDKIKQKFIEKQAQKAGNQTESEVRKEIEKEENLQREQAEGKDGDNSTKKESKKKGSKLERIFADENGVAHLEESKLIKGLTRNGKTTKRFDTLKQIIQKYPATISHLPKDVLVELFNAQGEKGFDSALTELCSVSVFAMINQIGEKKMDPNKLIKDCADFVNAIRQASAVKGGDQNDNSYESA